MPRKKTTVNERIENLTMMVKLMNTRITQIQEALDYHNISVPDKETIERMNKQFLPSVDYPVDYVDMSEKHPERVYDRLGTTPSPLSEKKRVRVESESV